MGHGWRRVTEAVRQRVGTDRTFKATSNARNEAMFKEATDFCTHLRVLERDLRNLHKDIDGTFANLRGILLAPLPRAYEEGQSGAVPTSDNTSLIGQGVQVDTISQAAQDLKTRLEDEVIQPLRQWLLAYKNVSDRMQKLEQLRLEVDSRRRTVDTLGYKLERLRATQPQPQHKEKHEQEVEKAGNVLQHKHEKLNRTSQAYSEMEQTVFNSLTTLIRDTGVLRDYAGLAMHLVQECYQQAHGAFSTAAPLLDYNSTTEHLLTQHPYNMPPPTERPPSQRDMYAPRPQHPDTQRAASSKDTGAGSDRANMYAVAEDTGGIDQRSPGRGYSNPGGLYPDPGALPVSTMQGVGMNPYQNAYAPGPPVGARYATTPNWQQQQQPGAAY